MNYYVLDVTKFLDKMDYSNETYRLMITYKIGLVIFELNESEV